MWVLVLMLLAVAVLSIVVAVACFFMCRALDAENDQLRQDVEHWKNEHAKLWGVASDGLRKVKSEMRACNSRHIDADAQEGE